MANSRRSAVAATLVLLSSLLLAVPVLADYAPDPTTTRDQIPNEYQWDPTHIFADDTAPKCVVCVQHDDFCLGVSKACRHV